MSNTLTSSGVDVFWTVATIAAIGKQIGKLEEQHKNSPHLQAVNQLEQRLESVLFSMANATPAASVDLITLNRDLDDLKSRIG